MIEMSQATRTKQRADDPVDRREVLLDAAIRVIAAQGLRGLTHRAVEAEAGVPHGSTTYYFGTRHDLVTALMKYIADRGAKQAEPIGRALSLMLADRSKPVDIDVISDSLIAWIDSEAEMELVRYELQIAGARDPEMKALMTEVCSRFAQMCEPIAIACGSRNPKRDAKVLQAAIDGLMFARLTITDPDDETMKRGIRVILEAIGNE